MQFTRLRLRGFKSFVDPTELLIEPGLTGVVGPNGCGKSNLVEALRWVMGETSAKRMRGGEMDDVIFGGSARRPAHNFAEVALHLDNANRTAPAQFNDLSELDVVRRIEREKGSTYRINGKEVRARDVQLLFADQATGAGATALVSQGRIGHIINAKPSERRHLLEEAAGITGLHSRRHEAELRLRASESNLERLDDVISTLASQLEALQRQARQAKRYRDLSEKIRRDEAILLHLEVTAARAELSAARERLQAAEAEVAELTRRTSAAATRQAEAQATLPELRQGEAEAAAEVQRLTLARQSLDQEEEQLAQASEQADERLAQIRADHERAEAQRSDACAAIARLEAEDAELAAAAADEAERKAAADQARAAAQDAAAASERELGELNQKVAADEARAQALDKRLHDLEQRRRRLQQQIDEVAAQRAKLAAEDAGGDAPLEEAAAALQAAEQALAEARASVDSAETGLAQAREDERQAQAALQAAESERSKLQAEIDALAGLLEQPQDSRWTPLIDAVRTQPGSEAALGAALGDDLSASAEADAPVHWLELPPLEDRQPLPEETVPLTELVTAPEVLRRRLSQVGVVADRTTGVRLQSRLHPGQRLVTREGDLWRWDGLVVAAEAPTAATQRLEQQNRLQALRAGLPELDGRLQAAGDAHAKAVESAAAAARREKEARQEASRAQSKLDQLRGEHARLERAAAAARSRLASLDESAERLAADLKEVKETEAQAESDKAALPDIAASKARANELRVIFTERWATLSDAQRELDHIVREAESRAQRRESIAAEMQAWKTRAEAAKRHLDELSERRAAVEREIQELAAKPAELAGKRERLAEALDSAEERRRTAADALAEGERHSSEADKALKAEEAKLGEAREARVRAEAHLEQTQATMQTLAERVRDRLDCGMEDILSQAGLSTDSALPDRAEVEDGLQRLIKARDNIGPVNLRAEHEAAELEERISGLRSEHEDLTSAIARLRQGIAAINREGRERLLAAFERVNERFAELFVRLFGGGRAHLALVESEDPLTAGLEIMASPPGKRLQAMSLLSGGEQALTALSLLFAVFLTNPAPICVLDEVDAPLDDANVDRFCTLVTELARGGETRFLIITHHRMTMSRMDRLFGVTMSERGVSQLVSVNLSSAEALRESA